MTSTELIDNIFSLECFCPNHHYHNQPNSWTIGISGSLLVSKTHAPECPYCRIDPPPAHLGQSYPSIIKAIKLVGLSQSLIEIAE
jgi:hypothetical protein